MTTQRAGEPTWLLLGPLDVGREMRSRTLGLGAVIRHFNDRAVPGLGGIWFAKPLVLAALGVSLASQAGMPGIEVANAIEALGCKLAFEQRQWRRDPRLRGQQKLRHKEGTAYKVVRKSNFYVSQPMRQQTVQPLPALGIVNALGERFSSFTLAEEGRTLLDYFSPAYKPSNAHLEAFLIEWVRDRDGKCRNMATPPLRDALSPNTALPAQCRDFLKILLQRPDSQHTSETRRRHALAWVDSLTPDAVIDWDRRPEPIAEAHWHDMQCGAEFFAARDAALTVLDAVEAGMATLGREYMNVGDLSTNVITSIATLRAKAAAFLAREYQTPSGLGESFCQECTAATDVKVLSSLVRRDGRVLVLRGNEIAAGAAYRRDASSAGGDTDEPGQEAIPLSGANAIRWPPGMSYRVKNLFLLNKDLQGQLDSWLAPTDGTNGN